MKKDRIPEIHFYEWRISAWAISETRDRLDAAGRGIFRELLDCCYGQGRFPDDQQWMIRRCACTSDELSRTWPLIEKHFPKTRNGSHRENLLANITRREYFLYIEGQRTRRKAAIDKHKHINEEEKLGPTPVDSRNDLTATAIQTNGNGNGKEKNNNPHPPSGEGGFSSTRPSGKPKKAKRTTEEIRRALGERLPWWDAFWAVYPCHEGMNPAMDAYEHKVHERDLAVQIYNGAKAYAAAIEQRRATDPATPVKYAQGWLNDERWKDELDDRAPSGLFGSNARQRSFVSDVTDVMQKRIQEKGIPW